MRTACVIATLGPKLFKIRDRNYTPSIRVVRDRLEGVEVLYYEDTNSGWCEGINEFGLCLVNSALLVRQDEKEGSQTATGEPPKRGLDGQRVLRILSQRDIKSALTEALFYKDGLCGHTFLSDGSKVFSIEKVKDQDPVVRDMDPKVPEVRTNHGLFLPGAGYVLGDSAVSSLQRRKIVQEALDSVDSLDDLAGHLLREHFGGPNNPLRDDPKGMRSTTMVVMDPSNLSMTLYLLGDKTVSYMGEVNRIEGGKLKFQKKSWDPKASKQADLNPPLGSGLCAIVDRATKQVRNPSDREEIVHKVESGESLPNNEAWKVYRGHDKERGSDFHSFSIPPHAQYRMDLREIRVQDVERALNSFAAHVKELKRTGNPALERILQQPHIVWKDPKTSLEIVFTADKGEIVLITTYWKGKKDPQPRSCDRSLRARAIRLAHRRSDLRPLLLPLLRG